MGAVNFADLVGLAGEVLPERAVMSLVNLTVNNGAGAGSVSHPSSGGHGGGHGATEMASCTSTSSPGTPGLLGSLGLGSSQPYTSVTCVPSTVASN